MGKNANRHKRAIKKEEILRTEEERQRLVTDVILQLASLKDPSPRVKWVDMESIKKLHVMLGLYAKFGKEFDTCLPLPQLEDRYIEVKLKCAKKRACTVVIRSGMFVEEDSEEWNEIV